MRSANPILVFLAIAGTTIANTQEACTAGFSTTNVNGLTCVSECNTDHGGGDYGATYTGSFSGCVTACTQDANCKTAQYNRGNGVCYLKNAINPASSSDNTDSITCQQPSTQPAQSACTAGFSTTNVDGLTCTSECNTDHAGGDYSAVYTGYFSGCVSACTQDATCKTAQYNRGNQVCYLKNAVNPGSPSGNTDSITCQQSASPSPSTTTTTSTSTPTNDAQSCSSVSSTQLYPSGRNCKTSCSSDRAGGDYSSSYVGNFQACIDACAADSRCVTAQYHRDNGYCYLKDSTHTLDPSSTTGNLSPNLHHDKTESQLTLTFRHGRLHQPTGILPTRQQHSTKTRPRSETRFGQFQWQIRTDIYLRFRPR